MISAIFLYYSGQILKRKAYGYLGYLYEKDLHHVYITAKFNRYFKRCNKIILTRYYKIAMTEMTAYLVLAFLIKRTFT